MQAVGRLTLSMLAGLALLHASCDLAAAQQWPSRLVKFVVAGAPGSAPDVISRIIGDRLTQKWRQPVIIDNQPGAGGNRGTAVAAHSAPDGYTFLFGQAAPLALNRYTFKQLPFDVEKDFDPVIMVGMSPMMIAASPKSNLHTVAELIAAAKKEPGKLTFATSSVRNIPHSTGELLKSLAQIDLLHVSYRANPQAIADTMTGIVDLMIDGIPVLMPHVKSGNLRMLGVTATQRLPGLEEYPTVAETVPGFSMAGWFAILAPKGTPPEVIARLNQDMQAVLAIPDVVTRMRDLGVYVEPQNKTPEQLAAFLKSEEEVFGRIAKAANIEPE